MNALSIGAPRLAHLAFAVATVVGCGLAAATEQPAQSAMRPVPWYELYEQAIGHVQRREWAEAERALSEAKQSGPKPGPRVLRYGSSVEPYFPDFYLGIVYQNTGRPAQALRAYQNAKLQGINSSLAEYREFDGLVAAAQREAREQPADAGSTPDEKGSTRPDSPSPLSAAVQAERKDLEEIPAGEPAGVSTATRETQGVRLFLAGDYQGTLETLSGLQTPVASFYRACSLAAMALLNPAAADRMTEARAEFAEAMKNRRQLQPHERYISPKILQALAPRAASD